MQKELWEKEYKELKNLPSSRTMRPSKAVRWFTEEFIPKSKTRPAKVLDLGSGQGRNSIFLAQQGTEVVGVEIVPEAIEWAERAAEKAGVADKVKFLEQNVGTPLPFDGETFDLVLDMMTLHLLSPGEREVYAREVSRLLKPGGYYLFYTISASSPAAKELFRTSPGPEPYSYVIPQSGMIEKGFFKEDFDEMFRTFGMLHLEEKTEFTPAFGDIYERVYHLGLMQKARQDAPGKPYPIV